MDFIFIAEKDCLRKQLYFLLTLSFQIKFLLGNKTSFPKMMVRLHWSWAQLKQTFVLVQNLAVFPICSVGLWELSHTGSARPEVISSVQILQQAMQVIRLCQ